MNPRKSISSGQSQQGGKKTDVVVNDKNPSRKRNRSISATFNRNSEQSVESPAQKKQNTATSIPIKSSLENSSDIFKTSINNIIQSSGNHSRKDVDAATIDGVIDKINGPMLRNSVEGVGTLLDVVPATSRAREKTAAVATTSHVIGREKMMRVEMKAQSPQTIKCDTLDIRSTDTLSSDHRLAVKKHYQNSLGWVGSFIFVNLCVFLGMIWSGLLLNERATYQLELLECRQRLQQTYQIMGLTVVFDDTVESNVEKIWNENNQKSISDRFEEHQFYWQELEAQVQYWRKEAKKYERFANGYREQCREDLQHLLGEVEPHKGTN